MATKRVCEKCSTALSDEYVIKIKIESDQWQTIPLTICPECFKKKMYRLAKNEKISKPDRNPCKTG